MFANLQRLMDERGVTPLQVAEYLGVRPRTVYMFLREKLPISYEEAVILRDAFFPDEDLERLFARDGRPADKSEAAHAFVDDMGDRMQWGRFDKAELSEFVRRCHVAVDETFGAPMCPFEDEGE